MPLSGFRELNERLAAEGKKTTPNPRNAAAGSLRQKNSQITAERPLNDLGPRPRPPRRAVRPRATGTRSSGCASAASARTRSRSVTRRSSPSRARCAEWEKRRIELDYEIDGIVIKVDSFAQQERLGALHDRPRWARAFKWAPMTATTKLNKIRIRVGRTGALNPWADARAGRGRRRHGLARDAAQRGGHQPQGHPRGRQVIVQRAGDVIPQVVGPVLPHQKGTKPFRMPKKCPLCGAEIVKPEGEAMHRCPNRACPSRGLESLINWVQAAADIEGVGEQSVRRLWDLGLVRSLPELYRLTKEQLHGARRLRRDLGDERDRVDRGVEGDSVQPRALRPQHPGRRLGDRRRTSRATSRTSTGCSTRRRRTSTEVEGIGPDRAEAIAEWFADDANRALVEELRALGLRFEIGDERGRSRAR